MTYFKLVYRDSSNYPAPVKEELVAIVEIGDKIYNLIDAIMELAECLNMKYLNWEVNQLFASGLRGEYLDEQNTAMVHRLIYSDYQRKDLILALVEYGDLKPHQMDYFKTQICQWLEEEGNA